MDCVGLCWQDAGLRGGTRAKWWRRLKWISFHPTKEYFDSKSCCAAFCKVYCANRSSKTICFIFFHFQHISIPSYNYYIYIYLMHTYTGVNIQYTYYFYKFIVSFKACCLGTSVAPSHFLLFEEEKRPPPPPPKGKPARRMPRRRETRNIWRCAYLVVLN